MRPPHQLLIRLALTIQAQYTAHANRPCLFELPHRAWQDCLRATRLLVYARRRRWSAPAEELAYRVRVACSAAAQELNRIDELLKPRVAARIPPLRDMYAELVALYDEYDTVRIDRKAGVLAVTTEPIELEGISLGPFEIALRWSALPDSRCYSVVAIQPQPSNCEAYLHPHVLHEQLCEGEGRLPIQRALADGRLCDFFEIVTRVLETYNADSAYLRLEDWYGISCSRCGDSTSADDAYSCSRCGTSLCFDCYERCSRCDDAYCSDCVTPCAGCEDVYCRACLESCPDCQGDHCEKCRDEDERCSNCRTAEAAEEPDAAVDSAGAAEPADAPAAIAASPPEADPAQRSAFAIYAHGLGEAGVPA